MNGEIGFIGRDELFHAMVKWNSFLVIEDLSIDDENVLKRKSKIICNLLAKTSEYIEK